MFFLLLLLVDSGRFCDPLSGLGMSLVQYQYRKYVFWILSKMSIGIENVWYGKVLYGAVYGGKRSVKCWYLYRTKHETLKDGGGISCVICSFLVYLDLCLDLGVMEWTSWWNVSLSFNCWVWLNYGRCCKIRYRQLSISTWQVIYEYFLTRMSTCSSQSSGLN